MLTQQDVREPLSTPLPTSALTSDEATHDHPAGQQLVLPLAELDSLPRPGTATARPFTPSRVAASVAAFHRAFRLPMARTPQVESIPSALMRLRESLLEEEVAEYMSASYRRDLVGMADALADIVYVVYGSALTFGVDLDAVIEEVHRSNMSKLDADGRPVLRSDGKVLKSPRYKEPDIEGALSRQLPLPF